MVKRNTSAFAWTFLFHAEFIDDDSGLYNYGFRFYNPYLGRWLSRDPIGERGGLNLYAMVGNNALNGRDILGLEPAPTRECPQGKVKDAKCLDAALDEYAISVAAAENEFNTATDDPWTDIGGDALLGAGAGAAGAGFSGAGRFAHWAALAGAAAAEANALKKYNEALEKYENALKDAKRKYDTAADNCGCVCPRENKTDLENAFDDFADSTKKR